MHPKTRYRSPEGLCGCEHNQSQNALPRASKSTEHADPKCSWAGQTFDTDELPDMATFSAASHRAQVWTATPWAYLRQVTCTRRQHAAQELRTCRQSRVHQPRRLCLAVWGSSEGFVPGDCRREPPAGLCVCSSCCQRPLRCRPATHVEMSQDLIGCCVTFGGVFCLTVHQVNAHLDKVGIEAMPGTRKV